MAVSRATTTPKTLPDARPRIPGRMGPSGVAMTGPASVGGASLATVIVSVASSHRAWSFGLQIAVDDLVGPAEARRPACR